LIPKRFEMRRKESQMKRASLAAFVLATAMAVCAGAAAQEQYPSRLITVVVPLTPGTTIDILARLFAESLSKRFGQQVIVAFAPAQAGSLRRRRSRAPPPMATRFCSPIPGMQSSAR